MFVINILSTVLAPRLSTVLVTRATRCDARSIPSEEDIFCQYMGSAPPVL